MPPLELPLQSNPGRYGADGAVRLINCYAEERGREGKIPFPLYCTDGLSLKATVTGGGVFRGAVVANDALYVCTGPLIVKWQHNTVTTIGGFPGSGPAYMQANQATSPQILVVSEGQAAYIENDVLIDLGDSDLPPPNSVVFLNQRFVASTTKAGQFHYSGLAAVTFGANDFFSAEFASDGLVRAFTRRGELLLFGTRTIEPWYNPEGGTPVFARSGTVVERGCLNGATVASVEETVIFVAEDRTVRALTGYATQRISNHAVEKSIRDTSALANMRAFAYAKDGHSFYVLTGADFTWVYDATTALWHERQSYALSYWRAKGYASFEGDHYTFDDEGKIYVISEDAFDENGAHLVFRVQVPVHASPKPVRLGEVRADVIPGVGLNSSDEHDANPQLMLSLSKDGGKTFGNERQMPMGRTGEYNRETRTTRLGTSREDGFVIALSASAAVVRGITGLWAEYKVLRH